jgi:serine/threonine protein kinase/Tfp pilus assembly protein PilF
MAIPLASAVTVCSICGEPLNAKGDCVACLLRTGLDDSVVEGAPPASLVFGDFEIAHREDGSLWELGHGAMGVTYLAVDNVLRRKVALKVIQVPVATRASHAVRERFLREARAAAALRHPNVAAVYQFGASQDGTRCYYAMELVEGETLENRVRRDGPLKPKLVVEIAMQITRALMAAAAHALIHRDLKPANIMLTRGDSETAELEVKIIDFGLAKAIANAGGEMDQTHEGFIGTPNFASPEQFGSGPVDVRSDIYSLGVTLWFAITGKTPFVGRNIEEFRRAQQSKELPTEQLKAARIPSRLRFLLKSMLAVEPAARPGIQELAVRLRHCSTQAGAVRRVSVALAAAVVLILGVVFFIFSSLRTHPTAGQSPSDPGVPEKSIAVLPFENLSNNREDASFADGVQDQILTNFARIADLKVIGRTSVMQYKSGVARNLRKIGRQLGVAHIVEGSVQRSGNRVRVNAQLVHARTDRHLWAQTYDRHLADIFAIQSEIAKTIADELQANLSPNEKSEIERPPTSDVSAFDLYTRAKSLFLSAHMSNTGKKDLLQAADMLNEAVARDPAFFRAYCQLARTHDLLHFLGFDHTSARLALAEAAIQAAFRLRPDAGEAHLARAENLYRGYLDYEGALAELEIARQTLPNDAWLMALKGFIERRQGHWDESTRDLEHALDLDPRNVFMLQQIATSYEYLRRYAEEALLYDRALAIEPHDVDTRLQRAWLEVLWKADTGPLHKLIDSIRATNPAAMPKVSGIWLLCALLERDTAAAHDALIASGEDTFLNNQAFHFNRPFVEGIIARMTKDEDKAHSAFIAARADQEKSVQAQPGYGPPLCVLALIDAALGRKEEALREARRALELLPLEKDAINGPLMIQYFAVIAAWVGEKDLACQQLEALLRYPGSINYGELKLSPFWDPLRGDPCFEKIVASLAPK